MSKDQAPEKALDLSALKDISTFGRDALLILVIAICIFNPASIKSFLDKSGLGKLSVFGISVEVKEEKQKVESAQTKVNEKVLSPAKSSEDQPPEASNKPIDPEFKQAIRNAERVAPQILPSAGWVFLGRVNKDKTNWVVGAASTVRATWPVKPDDVLTVKDDVYVRDVTQDTFHSSAPVVSIAKIGDKLTVVDLQYSPAKGGGFFVWAKVAIKLS